MQKYLIQVFILSLSPAFSSLIYFVCVRDLRSLIRDQTQAHDSESIKSKPLDHQGILSLTYFE